MAITFIGAATTAAATASTTLTLTKPSGGVTTDDLLVGYVVQYPGTGGTQVVVTPPSGWTLIRDIFSNRNNPFQLSVMYKFATGSEPSTWTGSFGTSRDSRIFITAAYRGAGGFLIEGPATSGATNSYSTATVNNTLNTSWRLTAAGYTSSSVTNPITINDVIQRSTNNATSTLALQLVAYDSNGAIVAGNTSQIASRSTNWSSSSAWIGVIQETSSAVVDITAPFPTMTAEGEEHNDATMTMTAPMATMTATGIQVSDVGGPLDVSVVVTMDATARQPTLAELVIPGADGSVMVSMTSDGEVHPYGPRVSKVEPESRTYYPVLE